MQKGALPGFRDFYPEDLALRAHIFEVWRRVATRYGFEEYDGPPLESLELYTAKSGEEIVGQLYNFTDKGDRAVALRPEMTPTLARMVAARANGLKKPIRWFSMPQLFRYERQQRGRLREHFQLNCDVIGTPSPQADAEVIALAVDVLRAFGLSDLDFKARISDRVVFDLLMGSIGVGSTQLPAVREVVDKIERRSPSDTEKALVAAGLSLDIAAEVVRCVSLTSLSDVRRIIDESPRRLALRSSGELDVGPIEQVMACLEAMGLGAFVQLDLKIVRGLAYYTGTVFELFNTRGELRAICGGGRYDKLAEAVGGVALDAVGFGMGDVVLGELLKARGHVPPAQGSADVFIAADGQEQVSFAPRLAHGLRELGMRVEFGFTGQTMSKQQDIAKSRNARVLVVVGAGDVQLKDLTTKSQHTVPMANAIAEIAKLLGR